MSSFLPMSRAEMDARGWEAIDVLLITGDDYFDSPTHGIAVIGRVLERAGYRVGIIARPDWTNADSLRRFGIPELFVGIGAGAVDSTLNNYTADLAPRQSDAYAAGDNACRRPNFATAVYCGAAKSAFPGVPIVLGGVEASTRRFAYYDYLKKKIRRSVLVDTRADILVFGGGEQTVIEIAGRLRQKAPLDNIDGTAMLTRAHPSNGIELPSYNMLQYEPALLIQQTHLLEKGLGPHKRESFLQQYDEGMVVCHPPRILTSADLDNTYTLPFTRTSHPSYLKDNVGEIPASIPVRWSVIAQRGCPGGCSFCALAYHQGRQVVSRSESSILNEVMALVSQKGFGGTITDIGGPTANAYGIGYKDVAQCQRCQRVSCFFPRICTNLETSQQRFINLLNATKRLPGIRHVYIASGIRHDLALMNHSFITLLAQSFTGGHLKAAPEHTSETVLKLMRKPPIQSFEEFERLFISAGRKGGLSQYVVPYFIAGFPGCTKDAADHTGTWLRKRNQRLQQVQNFIPLPGTMAAALFAAATDENGKPLHIPDAAERRRQKAILIGKSRMVQVRTGRSKKASPPIGPRRGKPAHRKGR